MGITDRDLERVMAARRALHAYEPYSPMTRPRAAGPATRTTPATTRSSRPRTDTR